VAEQQEVLLVADKALKAWQLLDGLVAVVLVAVPTPHQQVVKVVMADFHQAEAAVEAQVLQQAAQAVRARQVKLEFGVGNDIKQYNTIT